MALPKKPKRSPAEGELPFEYDWEAKLTYEGSTGYQSMLALWAEMDLVLADEFRDGNEGAHVELLGVTQRALAALSRGSALAGSPARTLASYQVLPTTT